MISVIITAWEEPNSLKECIVRILTQYIPDNFDEAFIQWGSDFEKIAGSFNRWHLYILGDNCD